jgi:hypothetical protein
VPDASMLLVLFTSSKTRDGLEKALRAVQS